jgi:hypothetical protein
MEFQPRKLSSSPQFFPTMPRWITSLALLLSLLCLTSPALALEPSEQKEFTEKEKERILLPCKKVGADRRIRCEVRELKRAQLEWGKSRPVNAYDVYDWLDLGGHHLRARLQQERMLKFTQHWQKTRKMYSQFEPTDDVNTRRLPYVNRVRESRLDCMYAQHGRPRARCFDIQVDVSQKMMRTPPR